MKKTIQKPENWQDFETLCKKLWGEVWEIPTEIKKNGRAGQPQAGIDIYGIPKGKEKYWGIQCKGKDEYSNTKLTKSEIENEIKKAKLFKPELEVFIFATTMNKDVEIEEYVRIKDLDNRKNNSFKVLLYCWEDIADLIEENSDTFNYYVNGKLHRSRFNISIGFSDYKSELNINPQFIRNIKRYVKSHPEESGLDNKINDVLGTTSLVKMARTFSAAYGGNGTNKNYSICPISITIENNGSNVIEDWRLTFEVENRFISLSDGEDSSSLLGFSNSIKRNTHCFDNIIEYVPFNNKPLIQKDLRRIEFYLIPEAKKYQLRIKWNLLARDYNTVGDLHINVFPKFEDNLQYITVDSEEEVRDEIISIEQKRTTIGNNLKYPELKYNPKNGLW